MPLHPKSAVFKPANSPFVALFEQNRVPSPEERKTIQQLLVEKTAHLSHLNSQVPKRRPGKKHTVPAELRTQLAYTRRWLEFHRALISPWRQLPAEILSAIFIFTLKYRGDPDEDGSWADDRAGTLLLCKICSAWRVIALRTPALWNTLSIFATGLERPPDWVSTWLTRSRSSPVYLQLLWDSRALPSVIDSLASAFANHLHHTAELSIDGLCVSDQIVADEAYPKLTFTPSVESLEAPLLTAVAVYLPQGSVWDWIHAACRASPCLSRLTTSHPSLGLFPIANLTELNWIHRAQMSQIFQIFEDAPRLRHVDLNFDGPVAPCSTASRLTMKSISKLELTSYDHLGEFLAQTEFPSIVILRICSLDAWPGPTFHAFLSRSLCALINISFFSCHISAPEIVACLQHSACNTLESLSVQDCTPVNGDVLLEYLTYHGPEHFPCCNPNLRTIKLHDIGAADGLLAEMVGSRCSMTLSSSPRGPARLTELWFTFTDVFTVRADHPNDWKRLRQLEKTMELKIRWPDIDYFGD
ncbi:hypothetical protein MSAN_00922300 [Mycena sanguinolenta]|uniref:F-box domain-containing protein n=1 Tax=Mycena sanguinolenta TaxID=230812 RepID=A0A8H6YWS5_9AGAR|nr:hypothetical protein MSAN_00922300 [Mycena sanguinolenta]